MGGKANKKSTKVKDLGTNGKIGDGGSESIHDNIMLWVIVFMLTLIPIIIRATVVESYVPKIISPLLDSGPRVDVFSYYKSIILLLAVVFATGVMLHKFRKGYQVAASYINIPLALLAILTCLSGVFADYKNIALAGSINRYEGVIALLCYLLIFFIVANTQFDTKVKKYISTALGVFIAVNSVVCFSSFLGHDLLKNPTFYSLIVPEFLRSQVFGTLQSTLSNPNYLSGSAAALFCYFAVCSIVGRRGRIVGAMIGLLCFGLVVASVSSSGFVTIVILIPVLFIFSVLNKDWRQGLAVLISIMILSTGLLLGMIKVNSQIGSETFETIKSVLSAEQTNDNSVGSTIQKNSVSRDQTSVEKELASLPKPGITAGTGRLYIWDKAIELIKSRPLLGYGPDTFAYYFPQNDINKVSNLGNYDTWVDKPHNMYLGMAFNSGILALLSFLALILLHFINTVRSLWRQRGRDIIILPAALFAAWMAFLIQYMFNDSTIGVSVIFWVLFGISVSLNNQLLGGAETETAAERVKRMR